MMCYHLGFRFHCFTEISYICILRHWGWDRSLHNGLGTTSTRKATWAPPMGRKMSHGQLLDWAMVGSKSEGHTTHDPTCCIFLLGLILRPCDIYHVWTCWNHSIHTKLSKPTPNSWRADLIEHDRTFTFRRCSSSWKPWNRHWWANGLRLKHTFAVPSCLSTLQTLVDHIQHSSYYRFV